MLDGSASSYGKHLSLIKTLSTLAGSLGSIFLFHVVGGGALAIFNLAIAPIEQLRGLTGSIEPLLFPKLVQDTRSVSTIVKFIRRTKLFFALLTVVIVMYILMAPLLFDLLFPKYQQSIVYTQAYAPTLIITVYALILSIILRAQAQLWKLYALSVCTVIAGLTLVPILTALWGIWGLIAATYSVKLIEAVSATYFLFFAPPGTTTSSTSTPPSVETSELVEQAGRDTIGR